VVLAAKGFPPAGLRSDDDNEGRTDLTEVERIRGYEAHAQTEQPPAVYLAMRRVTTLAAKESQTRSAESARTKGPSDVNDNDSFFPGQV
jgi:hypothetical protein